MTRMTQMTGMTELTHDPNNPNDMTGWQEHSQTINRLVYLCKEIEPN